MSRKTYEVKAYSRLIAFISLLFSSYSFIYLYISQSLLWIPFGLSSVLTIFIYLQGVNVFKYGINSLYSYRFVKYILKPICQILFFITCATGYIMFITSLPINDFSTLFIPSIIIMIVFLGASVGMYQVTNRNNKHTDE